MLPSISEFTALLKSTPLWYLDKNLIRLEQFLAIPENERSEGWKEKKEKFIQVLADLLENDEVLLGNQPEYFNDDDRMPVDTVVVHHTHSTPDMSTPFLNAHHLLRLYIPVFRSDAFKKNGEHQPISSGHFLNSNQTFVGYHYLVRESGLIEQTLKDEYVVFHAGDYKTNCRSIGIAIVDDLTDKSPSEEALNSLKELIKKYKPKVVLGHGEVVRGNGERVKTECPGNMFYIESGWKNQL